MMAVDIGPGPPARIGELRQLFIDEYDRGDYDASPDGRFLMVKTPPESVPRQINVVLNWFEELKRLVPTN